MARTGKPLASMEVVTIMILASVDTPDGSNLTVRGLPAAGIEMRPNTTSRRGVVPEREKEVVVGKSWRSGSRRAQIGKKVHFGRSDWEIVGIMDGRRGRGRTAKSGAT